jgi:hypothetical protein
VLKIKNIFEGLGLGRVVIKHQEDTREGQDDEKVESDAAHAPGVTVPYRVPINFRGMKMQKYV